MFGNGPFALQKFIANLSSKDSLPHAGTACLHYQELEEGSEHVASGLQIGLQSEIIGLLIGSEFPAFIQVQVDGHILSQNR